MTVCIFFNFLFYIGIQLSNSAERLTNTHTELINNVVLVLGLQKSGSVMHIHASILFMGFPGSSDGKASAYNAGDLGSIPE